jgi:acyl-CoA synthetase (AMP-forming)/AMP-acid ligase II/acyl carrier protein
MAETTLIVTGQTPGEAPKFLNLDTEALSKNKVVIESHAKNTTTIAGCGHVWMETAIKIVHPEEFSPVSAGEIGEIWVSGPTVAKGYWNKPEETQRTFHAFTKDGSGPYLRTGDLGFFHEEELYVTGRLKDLIIIRGANYYPSDIEFTVQKSHEALNENSGAAFPVIVNNQETLVIVQELKRTAMRMTSYDDVISAIRKAVSEEYEIESHAIVLIKTGSIPMTSSGKIQRRQTRYHFLNNELDVVASWERDYNEIQSEEKKQIPTEEILREWLVDWIIRNQQFRREEIDLDAAVTRYGIDSLAAVTLEMEISARFGFAWHVSSFMMNPTINALAKEGMLIYWESQKA